jgi:hypothetical protein
VGTDLLRAHPAHVEVNGECDQAPQETVRMVHIARDDRVDHARHSAIPHHTGVNPQGVDSSRQSTFSVMRPDITNY